MWSILLLAAVATADPGAKVLQLHPGGAVKVPVQPGGRLICDDLAVARPEYGSDGHASIRAVSPGHTTCGVWLVKGVPGGLYQVEVVSGQQQTAKGAAPLAPRGTKP